MILRRELRRPSGSSPERPGTTRRRGARTVHERHGLRRGHCPILRMVEANEPASPIDRETAIRLVRAAARAYCSMAALVTADGAPAASRRTWLKSAARLIRFAHLLESDGIQFSPALAAVLTRLLSREEPA
jgi:hypothetical protein